MSRTPQPRSAHARGVLADAAWSLEGPGPLRGSIRGSMPERALQVDLARFVIRLRTHIIATSMRSQMPRCSIDLR